MRCLTRCSLFTVFKILVISLFISTSASGTPRLLNYQGTLLDGSESPTDGIIEMSFKIYEVQEGGTVLWESGKHNVKVRSGEFSVTLGEMNPFSDDLFLRNTLYLATVVEGKELTGRMRLVSVPYALNCGIPKGVIVMWSGSAEQIPEGWALCDGKNATPDLRDRFIVGAGNEYSVDVVGGTRENDLAHHHGITPETPGTSDAGNHSHHIQYQFGIDFTIGTPTKKVQDRAYDATSVCSANHMHSLNIDTQEAGTHSHTVNSHNHGGVTGSGLFAPVENRPPYYALCFIMKL